MAPMTVQRSHRGGEQRQRVQVSGILGEDSEVQQGAVGQTGKVRGSALRNSDSVRRPRLALSTMHFGRPNVKQILHDEGEKKKSGIAETLSHSLVSRQRGGRLKTDRAPE